MKGITVILLSILLSCCLFSCSGDQSNGEEMKIKFFEISDSVIRNLEVGFPVDLEQLGYKYEKRPISDKPTAESLGVEIIDTLHNAGHMCNYELLSIVHSVNTNEWRFGYSRPFEGNAEYIFFSDCFYVAVDGNSGNIMMSWLEEG